MKNKFFKIGKVAGTFYDSESKSDTIIIYAMGAPTVPDNGLLNIAAPILKNNIDIFVPDYLGFGRSGGSLTPLNCITTLLTLNDNFLNGCSGVNYYDPEVRQFKYKRIIFLGKSLGAAYVPLLPRYNKNIKELAVFCGALDQSQQGAVKGEETNKSFIDSLSKDFHFLYRKMNIKKWWDHVNDKDGLSPMDNIKFLKNSKIFIAHGKKDMCVDYSKSLNFYNKIVQVFPERTDQFKLKLYKNGDHYSSTTNKAVVDFLKWLK